MTPGPARARPLLVGLGLGVLGLWPLVVALVLTGGSLGGWGAGFVATGAWLLVAALTVQVARARRERGRAAQYPGPAARRSDASAVAAAMVEAVAGRDWRELHLAVDDSGRRLTVALRNGQQEDVVEPWGTAFVARVDQLDRAVDRAAAAQGRLTVRVSRGGDAVVTVE